MTLSQNLPLQNQNLLYTEIRKIVWGFADMLRDKGKGTVEDYAKIVLPTCLVKRTLDLQEEFVSKYGSESFSMVDSGIIDVAVAIKNINSQKYRFFNNEVLLKKPQILLITWQDLISFEDNPSSEPRVVGVNKSLAFGQQYTTTAKNFIELMFEIIDAFNPTMTHVFQTFEFKQLLLQKNIIPLKNFYTTCHDELSRHQFTMQNISTDMFSDMYMDLIGRFANDSGKKGGEFFTPTDLVKNAWQFIDIKSYAQKLLSGEKTNLKIADPTSGSNTFLIYGFDLIKKMCEEIKQENDKYVPDTAFEFYGQELKAFQFCLGLINMIFHNTMEQYNSGISLANQNSDVISNYFNGIGQLKGKIDIVVANPPYGTKDYGVEYATHSKLADARWKWGVPNKSEGEFAFLMTIYDLLNKQGKSVVVMPLGTLFRDASAKIREQLIKEDSLEGIVTLPGNMFLTTSIPVCLWILNKNKNEADKGKVFMVNASKDFKKVGKFNEWQAQTSIDAYLARSTVQDYCGYVELAKLEKNKFNLSVQRYFSKEEVQEEIDFIALQKDIMVLEAKIAKEQKEMAPIFEQILELEGWSSEDVKEVNKLIADLDSNEKESI